MKANDYGLLIEKINRYGTDHIEARICRREDGKDYPLGCSSDGERFFSDNVPKHLIGTMLDGLGMYGFVTDGKDPAYIGYDIEYRDVYAMSERKLGAMLKTIKRVNARVDKDQAREAGDKFMALANVLKLSFVAERIGPRGPASQWRWMTIAEGRNRFRDLIEQTVAEMQARNKGAA